MRQANRGNIPATALALALLMLWQAAAMGIDAAYILPSPLQVILRLWELRQPLFGAHLPATMAVVGVGLAISVILGLGLAILMDRCPVAEKALYPLIIASQTIPVTALAPLFVLWFGYSLWSKVLVTVLMTFKTVTQNDDTMLVGETKVKTEGSEGQNKIVRRTKYINGAAQETTVVSTDVVKKATDRVVLQGSKEPQPKETTDTEENATEPPKVSSSDAANPQPSSSSKSRQIDGYSYSRMLSGPCTAYTGGGVTASGMSAAVGRVAVDPSVIPYGTHLYITSADGSYVYGYAVAADTGGFVSNSSTMIDLYMSSKAECSAFGRQTMNIYILD